MLKDDDGPKKARRAIGFAYDVIGETLCLSKICSCFAFSLSGARGRAILPGTPKTTDPGGAISRGVTSACELQ